MPAQNVMHMHRPLPIAAFTDAITSESHLRAFLPVQGLIDLRLGPQPLPHFGERRHLPPSEPHHALRLRGFPAFDPIVYKALIHPDRRRASPRPNRFLPIGGLGNPVSARRLRLDERAQKGDHRRFIPCSYIGHVRPSCRSNSVSGSFTGSGWFICHATANK
jgi:hypothetical protein